MPAVAPDRPRTSAVDGTSDAPPARVTVAHDIAAFATRAAWEDLSDAAKEALADASSDSNSIAKAIAAILKSLCADAGAR